MYVPCSGLSGENLTSPAKGPKLVQWYKGPCLLDTIGACAARHGSGVRDRCLYRTLIRLVSVY